jgi:hypothetical protein
MTDLYHGYATESDYHEHYTLLAEIERETDQTEIDSMKSRISVIVSRKIYNEVRTYTGINRI